MENECRSLLGDVLGHQVLSPQPARIRRFKYSYYLRFMASHDGASRTGYLAKVQARPEIHNLDEALARSDETRGQADFEFETLCELWRLFGTSGSGLSAIQPLGLVEPWGVIVTRELDARPLRELLELPRRRGRSGRHDDDDVFRLVGAWLRRFHDAAPSREEPIEIEAMEAELNRLADTSQGEEKQRAFSECLEATLTTLRSLRGRYSRVARLHSDFHSENILVTRDGRVAALDAWPQSPASIYEDLASLFTYTPLLKRHQVTHGVLLDRGRHRKLVELAVLGYGQRGMVERDVLALFCVLRILSKWRDNAAAASSNGPGRALRLVLMPHKRRYFTRLVRSWLRFAEDSGP